MPRELIARLKRRILPQLEDELDLYAALHVTDPDVADAEWIAGLNEADASEWRELLGSSAGHILAAIRLLAIRAASIGLSRGVMKVMPHRCEAESPFLNLLDAADQFARSPGGAGIRDALKETIFNCRVSTGISHARLEEQGVSSDLVFRLDLVSAQLERMEALLRLSSGREDGRAFASMLVRGFAEERGMRNLVRNSVNRLASQIVRHTGKSGEHYIAESRSEWWSMGYGAVGAGGITAFTALFKYVFAAMALAPLWTGIAHSLNYTASFVLMQFLGWMLASKMPSMTAAALCSALEKDDGMRSEVSLVTAITRTQTIVTVGNLLGAIPASILIDVLMQWKNGNPFLTHDAALHGIESNAFVAVPDRSVCGAHRLLSVAFQFGCRMDRQLDGAAPPSGGPRAEPETAAVYGHGIGGGAGADRRTSLQRDSWICMPGPAAWFASVCQRLRRRADRSSAHHLGERIAGL